ncbi:Peptidoglycan/LPS O-acetylase OafA/YrhL, contains acyltransferase and SGNH-hydrolase domains [Paraoerskovia marina]|uniref:Peptidoglycan/LPS O-acetylase OafA/YrhL, contains acyltransferase and SGNH-hydrolase domains n=1 Tax=Paraoerskovia marina TaxID=545619 RepID=A0A1H1QX30_9CELL|nr:Peptidoglycan/LPS O-acetylase OafA/YrhL, contains acyltransferase and SGNH-hydrolase domains [Paraoerskovia marina]
MGVDVFFVISGFLITSHLLRRPPRSASDLATFWARRVRRLLPASYLVLAATVLATVLVAPETALVPTLREVGAAALYVENWSLAAQSVDYLGAESAATPVQHFWSLSVEEQFYLLWPLALLVAAWVATKRRSTLASTAHVAILALVGASFVWSVVATATSPASAYFITPTRIWELGAGAALATLAATSAWRLHPALRVPTAWTGIALIVGSAVVMSGSTPFPGWAAGVPVVGAALVILADVTRGRGSPRLVGDLRPVQWVGDISYSLYLWHWPIVVLAPFVVAGNPDLLDRIAILTLSVVLAAVTKPHVEDRFRRHRGRARTTLFVTMGVSVAVGVACFFAASTLQDRSDARLDAAEESLDQPCIGAAALDEGVDCPADVPLILSPADAAADKPSAYEDDCWESPPFEETTTCAYGDVDGDVRVALIGNSHAGGLLPSLQELAEKNAWSLTTYVASQCPTSDALWEFESAEA